MNLIGALYSLLLCCNHGNAWQWLRHLGMYAAIERLECETGLELEYLLLPHNNHLCGVHVENVAMPFLYTLFKYSHGNLTHSCIKIV